MRHTHTPTTLLHRKIRYGLNKKREVVKQHCVRGCAHCSLLGFLSDVKWTGGRVERSLAPRGYKIDVYFDVNTNIVYAIVRLLRCSVAGGDCAVFVFLTSEYSLRGSL